MHGRMVHGADAAGNLTEAAQRYDAFGRFQRAADRGGLNKRLLDELERFPNVRVHFAHKLTGADFGRGLAWLEDRRSPLSTSTSGPSGRYAEIEISFDLLLGADGAHSAARFHLMKFARVSFAQTYIDTLWCEFRIEPVVLDNNSTGTSTTPSNSAGAKTTAETAEKNEQQKDWAISPSHLHIWPSADGQFMFIAIPSADKSFTCTLFMPPAHFSHIDSDPHALLPQLFTQNFPGVVDTLIPLADLHAQYANNPHLPLVSIKCAPYHFGSAAVLLGDAAHAMVPFYGQGMNAGLEDVRELFALLDARCSSSSPQAAKQDRAAALEAYTARRTPDGHAIADLAYGNYAEMRAGVTSPLYRARKAAEEWIAGNVPALGFATQYARVSFSTQRYSEVVSDVERQGRVLGWVGALGVLGLGGLVGGVAVRSRFWRSWG